MPTFKFSTALSIGIVIFLIWVGGLVRSTGSGMGCPDWPKCFGYYIPPTEVSQVTFSPGKHFKKGNMVVYENALWKAKQDLVAGETFTPEAWEKYTKHDYAIFNPFHTWTEFLNRLVGVLTGFVIIFMFWTSLAYRKEKPWIPIAAFAAVLLVAFEGWLGKLVVDSNLHEGMITIHMLVAMVLLMLLIVLRLAALDNKTGVAANRLHLWLGLAVCLITLAQIAIGTQLREAVDSAARSLGDDRRVDWLEATGEIFRLHSTFYFLVVAVVLLWVGQLRNLFEHAGIKTYTFLLLGLTLSEILFGIVMAKMAIPPVLQPLHLLFATLMFAVAFVLLAKLWRGVG